MLERTNQPDSASGPLHPPSGAKLGSSGPWAWIARRAEAIIFAVLGLATLGAILGPIVVSPFHVAPAYNEGWNAFQAQVAIRGGDLYPHMHALSANNYPPLSYYIVGAVGALLGDNILAGRLIALCCLLLVSAEVGFIVHKLGASKKIGLFAALFFLGYQGTRNGIYVALNDPQWLGHAFMVSGFALFVIRGSSNARLCGAAALMVAGGMVKHLLIATPVAVTLWLLFFERKTLGKWLLYSCALVGVALGVCFGKFGSTVLEALAATPRSFSATVWAWHWDEWFTPLLVPTLASVVLASLAWTKEVALVIFYVLTSALVVLVTMGGAGINPNAAFDLVIAEAIASGLCIEMLVRSAPGELQRRARVLCMAGLASSVLFGTPGRLSVTKRMINELPAQRAMWDAEVERLRAIPGPVACEQLALCYWAGKDFEIDFFLLGQKLETGTVSVDEVLEAIEARGIQAIEIERGWTQSGMSPRFPADFNSALSRKFSATPAALPGMSLLVAKPKMSAP